MCGILAILGIGEGAIRFRQTALSLSKRLRHRGPDWNGIFAEDDVVLAHERLAIVDVVSGAQPLYSSEKTIVLAVNGEIYNHIEIKETLIEEQVKLSKKSRQDIEEAWTSKSDCEVFLHLYNHRSRDGQRDIDTWLADDVRGMFAFVLYDRTQLRHIAARDPIGVIPLYMGWSDDGAIWFASELKALADNCHSFRQFPPGHSFDSSRPAGDQVRPYYQPRWYDISYMPSEPLNLAKLRAALVESVEAHLMSDVPFGVLLSGGLDSSLIASIASRLIRRRLLGKGEDQEVSTIHEMRSNSPNSVPWFARLRSFAVGLKNSPDLVAAQRVADFLGTAHYSFTYTVQEGLDAVSDVIYFLETFDVTTIRAATPMYLMSRLIKSTGVKMVLSGEGSDEIFGGYLYFHKAPNSTELQKETVRKLKDLHMYDCLRANKAMSAWGVEARVPFLDKDFLDVAMALDPAHKMARDEMTGEPRIEKWCLRKAFDTPDNPFLPKEVLWRQKEQFSDGVGYGWIDALKDFAETHVTDVMFETANFRFPESTPATKEAYLYRQIFEGHFPQPSARKTVPGGKSIACSTAAAIEWDASFHGRADPSGRAVLGIHNDAYAQASSNTANACRAKFVA